MNSVINPDVPIGTKALILSKHYYGVVSKRLESMDIERYFSILYFLAKNNGCTQQHICNSLIADKTVMVKVITYLMDAGYITREKNPKDRREQFVFLTKKGQKKTDEIVSVFDQVDLQMFEKISKTNRIAFLKVMVQLNENLKKLPSNDLYFEYNNAASFKVPKKKAK